MMYIYKKFLAFFVLALLVLFPLQNVLAQAVNTGLNIAPAPVPPAGTSLPPRLFGTAYTQLDCPDFNPVSTEVRLASSVITAVTGTKAGFFGSIDNPNAYPLTNVSLHIKVIKVDSHESYNINRSDIIDEFIAVKDLHIAAKSGTRIAFDWPVPLYAESGKYMVVPFVVSDQQSDISGSNIFDRSNGVPYPLVIDGQKSAMRFDRAQTKLNDSVYLGGAQIKRFNKFEDVKVSSVIVNPTNGLMNVPVTWKLYAWTSSDEKNLVDQGSQVVTLDPNSKTSFEYVATDHDHPLYELVVEAKYKESKSILETKFARIGIDEVKVNYLSTNRFPIKAGEEASVSACVRFFENISDASDSKVVLSILDKKGDILHTQEFAGKLKENLHAQTKFTSKKNYDSFAIKADVYQGGHIVATKSIAYDCEVMPNAACGGTETASRKNILGIGAGILAVCIIILLAILFKKRKIKTATMILVFAACLFAPTTAHAARYAPSINMDKVAFDYLLPFNNGMMHHAWPCFSIYYRTEITKEGDPSAGEFSPSYQFGTPPPDPVVTVGDRIRVRFMPLADNDIHMGFGNMGPDKCYWYDGSEVAQPYLGEWVAGAAAPNGWPDAPTGYFAAHSDYTTEGPQFRGYSLLFPLTVQPPNMVLENVTKMTCDPLDINKSTVCTLTEPGVATISMRFAQTYGHLRYSYQEQLNEDPWMGPVFSSSMNVFGINGAVITGGDVDFPAAVSAYNITVAGCPANNVPTAPTITGPTAGLVDQSYDFTFASTDADNQDLRYMVDWNNDGEADATAPSSGFVPSGQSVTASKAWASTGSKVFKVRAADSCSFSNWSEHTINITQTPPTTISCSAVPSPASLNTSMTWNGTTTPGDPITYTSWTWTGDITGTGQSRTTTYATPGIKNAHVVATYADGTKSADCSVNVSTCSPKSPNCPTSCGTSAGTANITQGTGLTTGSPLCAAGATYTTGSLVSAWSWTCRGTWQNNNESCSASCAGGTSYDASTGLCSAAPTDWCANIPGVQNDPAPYTITNGNCVFNAAKIEYFRFKPDVATSLCPAYWDTTVGAGLTMVCKIGSNTVPNDNLISGGSNIYGQAVGKTHTLSCDVRDSGNTLVAVLTSRAKCNSLGGIIEN